MEDLDTRTLTLLAKFRLITIVAVGLSTVSMFFGIVAIPIAYQRMQKLHSDILDGVDFCKLRNRDLWQQVVAVEIIKGHGDRASRISRQNQDWTGNSAASYEQASNGINVERAGYDSYGAPGIVPNGDGTGWGPSGGIKWPTTGGAGSGGESYATPGGGPGENTGDGNWPSDWRKTDETNKTNGGKPTQNDQQGPGDRAIPGEGGPTGPSTNRVAGFDQQRPAPPPIFPGRGSWQTPLGPGPGGYGRFITPGVGRIRDAGQCCTCHQGPVGQPGSPGPDGQDAEDGEPGMPGPDGDVQIPFLPAQQMRSCTQRPCPIGPPGYPGTSGLKGASGLTGGPGPQGEPGTPGPRGAPGLSGREGLDGIPGSNGQRGSPGQILYNVSEDGIRGPPGRPGTPGTPGQLGNSGLQGSQGPKGPLGDSGDNGPPGVPGINGPPGPNGIRGVKGTCDHCAPARTAAGY